jgi:pSer/pThr/pTyr-binding forkhead associated (FHA) protein
MTKPFDPQEELCKKIAIEIRNRRLAGEILPDSKVLDLYPGLSERLVVHLDRLRQFELAMQRSSSLPLPACPENDHLGRSDGLPSSEVIDAILNDSSPSRMVEPPARRELEGRPEPPLQSLLGNPEVVSEDESDFRVTFRQSSVSDSEGTMIPSNSGLALDENVSPTTRYCPTLRPPMPILHMLSDDQEFSMNYPLCGERFIIGRVNGNLLIPHDLSISSKHVEIQRRRKNQGFVWHLVDLKSTNGTFVRVHMATLRHNDMLLIGKERFRFLNLREETGLLHVTQSPGGDFWNFIGREVRIGRKSQGLNVCMNDPFVDPVHATFRYKNSKEWTVTDSNSLNGTWLRVRTGPIHDKFEFQIGEQRFRISIPSYLPTKPGFR